MSIVRRREVQARLEAPVTIERVQRALVTAATLVEIYGDVFLPIFERLERELLAMERQRSAGERARQLARRAAQDDPSPSKP